MAEPAPAAGEKGRSHEPPRVGVRHLQSALLFLGLLLAYMMRVNLSMAIVDMTDRRRQTYFDWSLSTQGVVLSSFFWGYVVLQVPAGELAARFGAKSLYATAIAANAALCLFIPTAAQIGGWQLVCGCRVLQGLAQAALFPSTHHLISKWVPVEEKGKLAAFIYAGAQLGVAVQLIASGYVAAAWGWAGIFYTNAALGAAWTAAYLLLGSSLPDHNRLISRQELQFIKSSLGSIDQEKPPRTPWRRALGSRPVWALLVAHCGQNWGFYTLLTEMPTYMAKVLGIDLKNNGLLSSLPYLGLFALSFAMGAATDAILRRRWLSVTNTRKLFNSVGLWSPALLLLGLSYVPPGRPALAVALLTLTVALNAGHLSGFILVHIDLAPTFSAALMGFTNCVAGVVSMVAPLVCGFIIRDEEDPEEWRKVFFLSSAIYFASNLFYVIFGTSQRQQWNDVIEKKDLDHKPDSLDTRL